MYVFSMTRKQPTIKQLRSHVVASLKATLKRKEQLAIQRKALERGLRYQEGKVIFVTKP